jgi:hypothetical protein
MKSDKPSRNEEEYFGVLSHAPSTDQPIYHPGNPLS